MGIYQEPLREKKSPSKVNKPKLRVGKVLTSGGYLWASVGGGYNTNDRDQYNTIHRYLDKLNGAAYGG